jgi:hypothetical protein
MALKNACGNDMFVIAIVGNGREREWKGVAEIEREIEGN